MACRCIKCGNYCDCGEKYCDNCFIENCQTDTEKNMCAGGRFYGEKLEPKVENPVGYAEL